ncbi:hypothetical protein, partial [Nevskia soli]|uniref:hypothetical protein n=1 Tax=Nevskia soli TaxID=418856 RepID=UPI001C5CB0D4
CDSPNPKLYFSPPFQHLTPKIPPPPPVRAKTTRYNPCRGTSVFIRVDPRLKSFKQQKIAKRTWGVIENNALHQKKRTRGTRI